MQSDWGYKEMMKKAEGFADKYRAEFWSTSSRTGGSGFGGKREEMEGRRGKEEGGRGRERGSIILSPIFVSVQGKT